MYKVDGKYEFERFEPKKNSCNSKVAELDTAGEDVILKYSKKFANFSKEAVLLGKIGSENPHPSFPELVYYNGNGEIRSGRKIMRGEIIILTHVGECLIQKCNLGEKESLNYFLGRVQESALALDYLHNEFQIVYGDVKPGHFTDNNGVGSVIDLNSWTIEGNINDYGYTLQFAAPEQIGNIPWDRRVDVFGVGNYLKAALTQDGNELPRELLIPVIMKATDMSRTKRYQCLGELVEALNIVRKQLI